MAPFQDKTKDDHALSNRIKLGKNSFYAAITSSCDVFLLVFAVLSGRYLGAESFGIFSYGLAITSILTFLLNLGLDSLAIRSISIRKDAAPKIIGAVLIWKTALSIIAVVGLGLVINKTNINPTARTVAYILCGSAILRSFIISMRAFFQAFGEFGRETILVAGERVSILLSGLTLLLMGKGVVALAIMFTGVRLISFIFYLVTFQHSISSIRWRLDLDHMKSFQLEALPYGIAVMTYGLYAQLDVLILSALKTEAEVGLFSAAYKIYEGFLAIPFVISAVLYPRLSSLFVSNKTKHYDLFERGMKYLFILSIPIAACGFLFSKRFIELTYGLEFSEASNLLIVLLVGVVFVFANSLMFTVFRSTGLQKWVMYISLIGLICKAILDVTFIPIFSIHGAVFGVVGSVVIMSIISATKLVLNGYRIKELMPVISKLIVAICFIVFVLKMFYFLPIMLVFIMFTCLYLILLFVMKIFDKYEIEMIRHLLPAKLQRI